MRAVWIILTLGLGTLLGLGFAGAWHPAGDSFAVLRLPLAAAFALMVIWAAWPRRIRWPLAVLALLVMAQIVVPRALPRQGVPKADWVLYQQNLLFSRRSNDAWLKEVARQSPDMLTLQEVSRRNRALLETLRPDYPTQVTCPFANVGGVAVLSRFPAIPGQKICAARDGLAGVQVQTAQGPVWLLSIHLHWPWPHGQAAQVDTLLPVLQGLEAPVIIGGDFNSVGWSHTLRRIGKISGTRRAGPWDATFHLPIMRTPVAIDHVLTSPGVAAAVTVQPKLGSDHRGVLARLAVGE
ncbi:endonuclease/exonuclease/phosphatase family protein [Roseovarius sp. MMSF_3281]|uniref:endonuclease/exonuclease/phosphatase family protein n=1 Tax=Roseovarius sp. MMSF_3281 TaxID=3046694 RepID=UPI00273FE814|nr:endonuclease/exonuclease/phosphatase family protein [Roseovarius sp. MMSF_3281]